MRKNYLNYVKPSLAEIKLCHEGYLLAGTGPGVDDKKNGGITTGTTTLQEGGTEEVEYEIITP